MPASFFTTLEGRPGLTAEFSTGEMFGGNEPYWRSGQVSNIDLKAEDIPQEASGKYPLRVEWNGFLTPTETGDYTVGVRLQGGFARVEVDGKPLAHGWVGAMRQPGESRARSPRAGEEGIRQSWLRARQRWASARRS